MMIRFVPELQSLTSPERDNRVQIVGNNIVRPLIQRDFAGLTKRSCRGLLEFGNGNLPSSRWITPGTPAPIGVSIQSPAFGGLGGGALIG
jgi:hypothetical protein